MPPPKNLKVSAGLLGFGRQGQFPNLNVAARSEYDGHLDSIQNSSPSNIETRVVSNAVVFEVPARRPFPVPARGPGAGDPG